MEKESNFKGGITRFWWIPLLTGLVSVGFGIWCLLAPVSAIPFFSYLFCAGLIVAGILNLSYAFTTTGFASNWGWAMALGFLEVIAGVWMLTLPAEVLSVAFVYAVGVWILVSAIMSVAEAGVMSSLSAGWIVWMVLLLIATVVFAIIFLTNPIAGGVAVWLYMGLALIFFGCYRCSLAFQVKSINRRMRDM